MKRRDLFKAALAPVAAPLVPVTAPQPKGLEQWIREAPTLPLSDLSPSDITEDQFRNLRSEEHTSELQSH